MEVEILSTNKNPPLRRYEVIFEIRHPNESTPKVYEVRKTISSLLASKLETTFITKIQSRAGESRSLGEAHVYTSEDDAKRLEPIHVIILNMEHSARQDELKKLAQRRAEAKAAIKKGGKK